MIRLFFVALAALPLVSLGQTAPGFSITGSVTGAKENGAVFLTDGSNPTDTVAAGKVKEGKFVLNGHVAEPNLYELGFEGAKKKVPLFIGNDKMMAMGTVDDLKVTGSASNTDFVDFQQEFNPYFMRLNTLMKVANSPDGAKTKDSLFRLYKKMADTIQAVLDQFIQKRPNSDVSPFVLVVVNQLVEEPATLD